MNIVFIGIYDGRVRLLRPLFVARISAGFPSPAEDWVEGRLDLNRHLIKHPTATFYMRVIGDSMDDEIKDGDIIIVDRAAEAEDGDTVVVRLFNDFTVKKLCLQGGKIRLIAANESYPPIEITEEMALKYGARCCGLFALIEILCLTSSHCATVITSTSHASESLTLS